MLSSRSWERSRRLLCFRQLVNVVHQGIDFIFGQAALEARHRAFTIGDDVDELRLRAPKTHVIELAGLCTKARLDVAQALAVGQLREGHSQKLVQTAEGAHVEIAAILSHQTTKGIPRRELHELGENQIATVHQHLPGKSRDSAENTLANSNR